MRPLAERRCRNRRHDWRNSANGHSRSTMAGSTLPGERLVALHVWAWPAMGEGDRMPRVRQWLHDDTLVGAEVGRRPRSSPTPILRSTPTAIHGCWCSPMTRRRALGRLIQRCWRSRLTVWRHCWGYRPRTLRRANWHMLSAIWPRWRPPSASAQRDEPALL